MAHMLIHVYLSKTVKTDPKVQLLTILRHNFTFLKSWKVLVYPAGSDACELNSKGMPMISVTRALPRFYGDKGTGFSTCVSGPSYHLWDLSQDF